MARIILKDTVGCFWDFFCNEKSELCYIKNEKESILQSGVYDDFDIISDEYGNFHIVIQDTSGGLIYLTLSGGQWRRFVILNSRTHEKRMHNFKLFMAGERLHCFYALDSDSKALLVHHVFSAADSTETPSVIDCCTPAEKFCCAFDGKNEFHVFYSNGEGEFKYKIISAAKRSHTDSALEVDDCIISACAVWSGGCLHILYSAKIKMYYALIYYNTLLKERKIISFSDCCSADKCVFAGEGTVFVQWRERMQFYQCASSDGGASFKKPAVISESKGKRAVTVRIRRGASPHCADIDFCIALREGSAIRLPENDIYFGKNNLAKAQSFNSSTPKSSASSHNQSEKGGQAELILAKLMKNERELIRLNTLINNLSEKISCLAREGASAPTVCESASAFDDGDALEKFEKTDINSISFENSKKF